MKNVCPRKDLITEKEYINLFVVNTFQQKSVIEKEKETYKLSVLTKT